MTLREVIGGSFKEMGGGVSDLVGGDLNGLKRIVDGLGGFLALAVVTLPLWAIAIFALSR